jgi:hypothetical protein
VYFRHNHFLIAEKTWTVTGTIAAACLRAPGKFLCSPGDSGGYCSRFWVSLAMFATKLLIYNARYSILPTCHWCSVHGQGL